MSLLQMNRPTWRNRVMGVIEPAVRPRTVSAACACVALLALTLSAARAADDKTYVMKLGTATINDAQHEWCKRFVAMVEKDSGGRIKGEIYPASQLGAIPRQIEGVQFGAIQGYVGPPEFLAGIDERYEVLSAPGLVADLAHEVRVVSDTELQKLMLGLGGAARGSTARSFSFHNRHWSSHALRSLTSPTSPARSCVS